MSKTTLLALSIILLTILGVFIYFYITKNSEWLNGNTQKDTNSNNIPDEVNTNDTFILKKEYVSENSWEYKVTGQLPNPCYSATVDTLVAESYPEQVTINITVNKPNSDKICAQVISDFEYEGSLSASEQAYFTLIVK